MSEYNLPYFPFHMEPWGECYDARSLSDSTRLMFYDLLCYLWRNEGMIKNDDREIAYNLRKLPEQWQSAKRDLLQAGFIHEIQANRMLHCPLLRMEYERVADICQKQHKFHTAGGIARAKQLAAKSQKT